MCIPPDNSNEAKVLGNFAVPLAFGPLAAPAEGTPDWVQLMLEGKYIPTIDSATRMATICRPGRVRRTPAFWLLSCDPALLSDFHRHYCSRVAGSRRSR
jgi:hypothetical protein